MSLILKTDTKYTGVVAARHIIEFLKTPAEKTRYLKDTLAAINADSSYLTDSTSSAITDQLVAHVKRVQKAGAQVLSIAYTLKALVFVAKNNLQYVDYSAYSADFGVKLNNENKVIQIHSINPNASIQGTYSNLVLKKVDGENIITSTINNYELLISVNKQKIDKGLILGSCIIQQGETLSKNESLRLQSSALGDKVLYSYFSVGRNHDGSSALLMVPTSGAGNKIFESSAQNKDYFNKSGTVAKYEYGTSNNKLIVNGDIVIASTATDLMSDLSSELVFTRLNTYHDSSGIAETWIINSKDDLLANALSIHLNRQ